MNAGTSFAVFCDTSAAFAASAAARRAANAGAMVFIAAVIAISSGISGLRPSSTDVEFTTDVATSTGCPRYFACMSGGRSSA